MKLQSKLTVLLAVVFVVYLGVDYAVQRFVMYPSFVTLERDEATNDLARCRQAIDREIDHLSTLCFDWAAWTDSYRYVQGQMPEYFEANLANLDWFSDIHLGVIYIVSSSGEVVFGNSMDVETQEQLQLGFPADRWPTDHPLLALESSPESVREGIVMTQHGPLMVVSRPILTSEYEGPMMGAFVMGRLLDDEAIAGLVEQTRVKFDLWPFGDDAPDGVDHAALTEAARADDVLIETRGENLLAMYSVIKDIAGAPALVMRADVPRDITARGRVALSFAVYSLIAVGTLIACAVLGALRRIVVAPIAHLTSHAVEIASSSDLTSRIGMDRRDELGVLASEFDRMVGRLSESRSKLVDVSRQAGMAEIARGVLHNVGNVLSNVKVVTNSLATRARQSKVASLQRVVDLLESHRDDLETFLTDDEQGRQLVPYLAELTNHLVGESQKSLGDLEALQTNLQHMSQVINVQQLMARAAEVKEPTLLQDLAASALASVEASYVRHGIEVVREWQDAPAVIIDRGKVLQVLVNLLTNANEATQRVEQGQHRVTLRVSSVDGRAQFEVTDSGAGIAPGQLTRIFSEGFTTKQDGHGFGLHYSALAAKEMGGSLQAHSDGIGTGATFVLDLPVERVARSSAA